MKLEDWMAQSVKEKLCSWRIGWQEVWRTGSGAEGLDERKCGGQSLELEDWKAGSVEDSLWSWRIGGREVWRTGSGAGGLDGRIAGSVKDKV